MAFCTAGSVSDLRDSPVDSTRQELTHVKVGGQPSHIFQADTGQ